MTNERGKIINDACEILKKTYKEVKSLNNEVGEILKNYNEGLEFTEEWSRGGKYLRLRNNHFFIYQEEIDIEKLEGEEGAKEFFVLIFIFHDGPRVSRINLRNEPEIWAGKGKAKNANIRYYSFRNIFENPREGFGGEEIRVGGTVFDYYWEDEEKDEYWEGKFVGYPMIEITNREEAKKKLADKLF